MNIIAADVGGTKTHIACARSDAPQHILFEARYKSNAFTGFEPLLETFINDYRGVIDSTDNLAIDQLALALPGPVNGDTASLTNLPWSINKQTIIDSFQVRNISFMNDFQASAFGTYQLSPTDYICLNQGTLSSDTGRNPLQVAVGAGTGLGLAWTQKVNGTIHAFSTEGGHIDFAPASEVQVDLLTYLEQQYGHVSYERVLSGPGLEMLYRFYCQQADREQQQVSAAWINEHANNDPAARNAIELFVSIYGAYIGNIALLYKPGGGIYITGGIAAKIQDQMKSSHFIDAYCNKGRMQPVVEQIAVNLVTNERIGVLGALSAAAISSR